jgi:16S rRNA (adenine1518-N6/adenine1519-N6)-dimethyltransferase
LQTLADIKLLLESAGLSPRKSLGQNFLIDKNLIGRLLDSAKLAPGELVLEVGPGTGTLTEGLLERGCRVVACELDRGLAEMLRTRVPTLPIPGAATNFTLIEGDCLGKHRSLNADAASALRAGAQPFKLVANLPYAAATPLMLTLLINHPQCSLQAVTIQKEVAERIAAKPGTDAYGALSIVAQAMAEISTVATLPPECFWPRPDVTSAMVLVTRRANPLTADPAGLLDLCQRMFASRRKQIGTTLGRSTVLPPGISADQRPEALTVEQFVQLQESLRSAGAAKQAPTS